MKHTIGDAWYLARTDTWRLLHRREVLVWTFVMPVLFFYFIGMVNRGGSPDEKDTLAVSAAPDAGFLADELTRRLGSRDFQIVVPESRERFLQYGRRLEIPAGFTAAVLAGTPMKVRFSRTGQDQGADYDRVRISRATYSVLADLIAIRRDGAEPTPERFRQLAAEPRSIQLDVKTAGHRIVPPSGYEQSVPGVMVMFTLTVLFTSGGVSLLLERTGGILRRLAYTPMSRGAVVLGKWAARMAIGALQIAIAMIAGSVLFHVRWGANLPMVVVVMLAYGGLAATLAMLLGNFGRSVPQVIGLGVISGNLMAGLGGCWWPIEVTPRWAQKLALFLPTGWTMDALHKLVNFGDSPAAVIPHVCVSVALALAGGWLLARTFRFE
jgi:ABC-type multidrug transport system permease subunit